MHLIRLIYVSKTASNLGPKDVESIIHSAKNYNHNNGVTGLLFYSSQYFIQCLEGSREAINHTYHKIQSDKRHTDITILDYAEIVERDFEHWLMGYMPQSSLTEPLILKYSCSKLIAPYEMSAASAYKMMLSLKNGLTVG